MMSVGQTWLQTKPISYICEDQGDRGGLIKNRLAKVNDATNLGLGFNDMIAPDTDNYFYDNNGNLIEDRHKDIAVEHNYLDLPRKAVFFGAQEDVEFTYTAAGEKLTRNFTQGNTVTSNSEYCSGIEYNENGLEAIYTAEGRVLITNTMTPTWEYQYYLTDQVGNVRSIVRPIRDGEPIATGETYKIVQAVDYYPFGLEFQKTSGENDYAFNSIEKDEELEVNMAMFRAYDPAIGRWWQSDPLATFAPNMTPYRFGFNNPITYADPLGLYEESTDKEKRKAERKKRRQMNRASRKMRRNNRRVRNTRRNVRGGGTARTGNNGSQSGNASCPTCPEPTYQRYTNSDGSSVWLVDVGQNIPVSASVFTSTPYAEVTYSREQAQADKQRKVEGLVYTGDLIAHAAYTFTLANWGSQNPSPATFAFKSPVSILGNSMRTPRLLNQVNGVETLLERATMLRNTKNAFQYTLKGNGEAIFKAITQGGKPLPEGRFLLSDGTNIGKHFSRTTGEFTINMKRNGQLYKIRITQ